MVVFCFVIGSWEDVCPCHAYALETDVMYVMYLLGDKTMSAALQGSPVRIVAVSSTVHRHAGFDIDDLHFRHRSYTGMASYAQSKLCNILFVKELASR